MAISDLALLDQLDLEKRLLARVKTANTSKPPEDDVVLFLARRMIEVRIAAINAEIGIATPLPPGSLPTVIVVIGDSIGEGFAAGPWSAFTHLGYDASVITVFNQFSIGGRTVRQIPDDVPGGVDSFYDPGKRLVVVLQRGTNDIGNEQKTGEETYAMYRPLIPYYKSQGAYVGICTLLPRNASNYPFTPTNQTERLNYNNLVYANDAGADFIIDYARDPVMAAPGAENGSLYADGLHPNRSGQERLVIVDQAALEPTFKLPVRASQTALPAPYTRFVNRHNVSETRNGPGYDYATISGTDFGHGTYALTSGTISGDGMFYAGIGGLPQTGSGVLLGLCTTDSNPESFYQSSIGIYTTNRRTNYSALSGGDAEKDTGIPIAVGDLIGVRRTGTTLNAVVSKDGGASWQVAYTVTGVSKPLIGLFDGGEPGAGGTLTQLSRA